MAEKITPGLIVLHGNQLEQLRTVVFQWLREHPLGPLEPEIFLVQSNGVAEWLKIAIAEETGVCAATRIELPGRFLWGIYRSMLGRDQIPTSSSLDQAPLTWRLMRLIPELLEASDFAPLGRFLADGEPERRLQLAQKLAGLIDLYQLYRADWLDDWVNHVDQLQRAQGPALPLPPDQLWQAQLWRAVLNDIPKESRGLGRIHIHHRFVQAIADGASPVAPLPRRVVLFGISTIPRQTLEALSALSAHTQVILAVPNPCQFYWGDIIDASQFLKSQARRQQLKGGTDLSLIAPEQLHAHCHPLLANWGRQGRDFIRMLDDFDNAEQTRQRFANLRIDLFTEGLGNHLLERVQCAIRDLLPVNEHPAVPFDSTDRSIEFHVAHSAQREVEILHDQILAMLAEPGEEPLRPRDIIVMVPDIDAFSPAIRSVFGQYSRHDARTIPYEIGDVHDRRSNPVLIAMEWLLRLPQQRCGQSELRDLLEVPALAARFGLEQEDLPQLAQWIDGAGVRWGLDQAHRNGLGLGATGEQNSWIFGIQRMLLGYASGDNSTYEGIEAYAEVGGLRAALAGSLAQFVTALIEWRAVLDRTFAPAEWGVQLRALMQAFFSEQDEADQAMLTRIDESLQAWLAACADADYDEPVSLDVVRVAVMEPIDEPTLLHRFVSGGVTFCTLMPMRAVPFKVICLLGMNDGDFPRRSQHVDFDLLALPDMQRPGDRSRRDDDRYLMLEALLSARSKLYISWVGHNIRDNSEQPCSVLVAQLRDYLAAGWQCDLNAMTHHHPLQPFSRHYFEKDGLLTYAKEWRKAHTFAADDSASDAVLPEWPLEPDFKLRIAELARFVKQPVKYFFRERLGVLFSDDQSAGEDEEPFGLDSLEEYALVDSLLSDAGEPEAIGQVSAQLKEKAARLGREGVMPIGLAGQYWQEKLVKELAPIRREWLKLCAAYPLPAEKIPVMLTQEDIHLEDWLDRIQTNGDELVWLTQIASRITSKEKPRGEKLVDAWIRLLVAAALGHVVTGYLVARDAILIMEPLEPDSSQAILTNLLQLWRTGRNRPLPTACRTALAFIAEGSPWDVYNGGYDNNPPAESADLCLARLWPSYAELSAEPEFDGCSRALYQPLKDWLDSKVKVQLFEKNAATEEDQ